MMAGACVWLMDLVLRFGYQAMLTHTSTVTVTTLPGDVVQISFPKRNFSYSSGQYVFICIPALSLFEWHPFSISSSPHQDEVTIHIRALGGWTRHLQNLSLSEAGTQHLKMYWEGPFGNPKVEIWGARYKSFLLISGGIGVTPIQAITKQLLDQHSRGRPINRIRFVWTVRDRAMLTALHELNYSPRLPTVFTPDLLQAQNEDINLHAEFYLTGQRYSDENAGQYHHRGEDDMESPQDSTQSVALKYGRPDLKTIFEEMQVCATQNGDARVATLVCGPKPMVNQVKHLCHEMSCSTMHFDCSEEIFEF